MVKPLKIGQVQLVNNVILAPMAGITDKSFRQLCRELGAGLTYSEMVSGKSIQYDNFKELLDTSEDEAPWTVQLFGREPGILADAVRRIDYLKNVSIIDINMGCPAPKIVKNGEGSALMKEPLLIGKIVAAVSAATPKPVTVKIRKGFTGESANAVEIAKIAQESGAAAVTVHGRTRDQFYSGKADWDAIAAVKAALKIPVIANGDVTSPESAKNILDYTACDGLMIARATMGAPWIFDQIVNGAEEPDWPKKFEIALRHSRMIIEHKGERLGALEMRKHLAWYIKGLPSATKLRLQINKVKNFDDIQTIVYTAMVLIPG